jgi:hypothetical protein
MSKPTTRMPSATPSAAPSSMSPAAAKPLQPAPDNGIQFADPTRSALTHPPVVAIKRRGKQLGARIPEELYERLVACADGTRIPQGRLIERALDVELKGHGY